MYKRQEDTLDTQRDHPRLINDAAALLATDGVLYFSTNKRGFKLDETALPGLQATDITKQSVDPDFDRPRPPHKCWRIVKPT